MMRRSFGKTIMTGKDLERRLFLGGALALGALGMVRSSSAQINGGAGELVSEDPAFAVSTSIGGLTFVAQDAAGPEGDLPTNAAAQAERTLTHLRRALASRGNRIDDLAFLRVLLADYRTAPEIASLIRAAFGPERAPALCILGVSSLGPGRLVRMDGVASTLADRVQITVPDLPLSPGAYCHAVRVGDLIFLGALDGAVPDSPAIGEGFQAILRAVGAGPADIFDYFTFLRGLSETSVRDAYNRQHNAEFKPYFAGDEFPAQSRIGMPELGPGVAVRTYAIATRAARHYIASDLVRRTPGVFSQSVRVGDWLFLAGQDSVDVNQHNLWIGDLGRQTEQCLVNLENILKAAGGGLGDIVKTGVYLQSGLDPALFLDAYRSYFNRRLGRAERPAGLTMSVEALRPEMLVEIDAVAWLGKK
jgi:2-iminobutanoate/2-iminopropanoate deaminase